MKKILLSFLFLTPFVATFCRNGVTLPMLYHKDKLILQITTVQNDTLHFLFDTGSRDLLIDSSIAAKYQLISDKSRNTMVPFANNIILPGKTFFKKKIFSDTLLNSYYPWGTAVNMANLNIPSHIKIDGIIGISEDLENHSVLMDFTNNTLSIADSSTNYNLPTISKSVKMLYSDDGCESSRSKFSKVRPASKFRGHYKRGAVIETNLIFDTGCHWETAFVSTFTLDDVFKKGSLYSKKALPNYHDEQENVDYWIADSIIISDKITVKKVKTVYIKSYSNYTFGDLQIGVLLGAPFFKRFKQVYFNFPAKRIDFVK